jgi:hypothetical protein
MIAQDSTVADPAIPRSSAQGGDVSRVHGEDFEGFEDPDLRQPAK